MYIYTNTTTYRNFFLLVIDILVDGFSFAFALPALWRHSEAEWWWTWKDQTLLIHLIFDYKRVTWTYHVDASAG